MDCCSQSELGWWQMEDCGHIMCDGVLAGLPVARECAENIGWRELLGDGKGLVDVPGLQR